MGLHGKSQGPKFFEISGASIDGTVITDSFDTDWIGVGGAESIAIYINVASVGGTSPTMDIDVEWSPDGGTTVFDMPDGTNSQTVADMAQITTNGSYMIHFPLPPCGPDSNAKLRLEGTVGGTSETFTTKAWRSLFYPS